MQNSSIVSLHKADCPFDLGYHVSVACRMASTLPRGRTLRWDPSGRDRLGTQTLMDFTH